jgi:hypothetical protein
MAALREMEPLPEVLARLESIEKSLGGDSPPSSRDRGDAGTRAPAPAPASPAARPAPVDEKKKTIGEAAADPMVQKAVRLFDGRIINGD